MVKSVLLLFVVVLYAWFFGEEVDCIRITCFCCCSNRFKLGALNCELRRDVCFVLPGIKAYGYVRERYEKVTSYVPGLTAFAFCFSAREGGAGLGCRAESPAMRLLSIHPGKTTNSGKCQTKEQCLPQCWEGETHRRHMHARVSCEEVTPCMYRHTRSVVV